MKAACQFVRSGDAWMCEACGRRVRSDAATLPTAVCRGPRGLGDMVADGLSAVGVTKERVQAVASVVGVKDCGCVKRQAALNKLGERIGLPPGRGDNNHE